MRRLLLLLALSVAATAQAPAPDTVRVLADVVVGSEAMARPGVSRIPVAGVISRAPETLADVVRLVPSATAPTNSRGQALLYVRGAGERQTAVLFDGAPLTIPWDRRADLGLVPAGVVGAADVVRGPASLAWGPNAGGGALDLVPRTLGARGRIVEAEVAGGLPARGRVAASALASDGRRTLSLALDLGARDGDALAEPLPFGQPPGALRTNTDRRGIAALVRGTAGPWSATLLHLDAARGVAPEGHLDPAVERVRYWRLPAQRQTLLTGRHRGDRLDVTAWAQAADQTTTSYQSVAYDAVDGEQDDRDRSAGARGALALPVGFATVRLLATGFVAEHVQAEDGARDRFVTAEWRAGAEAEGWAGPARVLAGLAVDGFEPIETAGRASAGTFRSWALTARAERAVGPATLHAGVARAARFPTTRELFGEALGRFALNPDLRPEATWQGEVGAGWARGDAEGHAVVFARRTDDAIEQEQLADGRRQRVNLGGSAAVGAEGSGALRRGALRLDASATLLYQRGWTDDASGIRLPERPGALGRLAVSVLPATGWTWAAEAVATGSAVSLGPDGLIDLPASVVLGGRLGYRWRLGPGLLGAFARIDNALDAVVLPQAGLPAPGRELRVGLRWVG